MNFIFPKQKQNINKLKKLFDALSNPKVYDIIMEGAVRSGKNVSLAFLMVDFYLSSYDKYHLILSTNTKNAFQNFAESNGLGLYNNLDARGI